MSGDLEDFLRRAAQRRQEKAAEQQRPVAAKPPRPEYSDRRRERVTRDHDADEILTAEVVSEPQESDPNSYANRMKRVAEAKRLAAEVEAEVAQESGNSKKKNRAEESPLPMTGSSVHDLLGMLRRPGGVQQAILLREILDRPEHRW